MAKRKIDVLPTTPSKLLRLAVKDARAVAKMKTRSLDMFTWHTPLKGGKCVVCMAGAVMDRSLGANPKRLLHPGCFHYNNAYSLRLIDALRISRDAFLPPSLFIGHPALQLIRKHLNRHTGRAPWRIYLKAADMLEADGY